LSARAGHVYGYARKSHVYLTMERTSLFAVTAPLLIRLPSGDKRIMAERFPHPRGVLYFEPFWRDNRRQPAIHVAEGAIRGEGPWKVGDAVVTVLGCSDPHLAAEWQEWQQCLLEGGVYSERGATLEAARMHGGLVKTGD